jgi:hypothetical protein
LVHETSAKISLPLVSQRFGSRRPNREGCRRADRVGLTQRLTVNRRLAEASPSRCQKYPGNEWMEFGFHILFSLNGFIVVPP